MKLLILIKNNFKLYIHNSLLLKIDNNKYI